MQNTLAAGTFSGQVLDASHDAWGMFWKLFLNPLMLGFILLVGAIILGLGFAFRRTASAAIIFIRAIVAILALLLLYAATCYAGIHWDKNLLWILEYALSLPAIHI